MATRRNRKPHNNVVNKPQENKGLDAPNKLKLLFSIVERSKTDFYVSALEGFDVNMQTILYAKGTAPTDILNLLGLHDQGKAVIISVVREDMVKEILEKYEDRYFKTKNGKGIAFTVPISSVIGVLVYKFLSDTKEM